MDARTKQLIAVGASATANCIPCLQGIVAKARASGIDDTEIKIAVGVGRVVRKGAAASWDDEAKALLGELAAQPCPLQEA